MPSDLRRQAVTRAHTQIGGNKINSLESSSKSILKISISFYVFLSQMEMKHFFLFCHSRGNRVLSEGKDFTTSTHRTPGLIPKFVLQLYSHQYSLAFGSHLDNQTKINN